MPKTEAKSVSKQCLITLENITQKSSVMVRVKNDRATIIYCLKDLSTLQQLKSYPLTSSAGEYEYVCLKDIQRSLFIKIQNEDANDKLVTLTDKILFQKWRFQPLPSAQLRQDTSRFFSNPRQGLRSGIIASNVSTAVIMMFNKHRFEKNMVLYYIVASAVFALFGGAQGYLTSRRGIAARPEDSQQQRDYPERTNREHQLILILGIVLFIHGSLRISAGIDNAAPRSPAP